MAVRCLCAFMRCTLSVRTIVSTLQSSMATRGVPCWVLMYNKARTVQTWRVRIRTFVWPVALRACAPFPEMYPLIVLHTSISIYFFVFLKIFYCFLSCVTKKRSWISLCADPATKMLDIDQAAWARTNSVFFHQACKKWNSYFLRFFKLAKNEIHVFWGFLNLQKMKFMFFEVFKLAKKWNSCFLRFFKLAKN